VPQKTQKVQILNYKSRITLCKRPAPGISTKVPKKRNGFSGKLLLPNQSAWFSEICGKKGNQIHMAQPKFSFYWQLSATLLARPDTTYIHSEKNKEPIKELHFRDIIWKALGFNAFF
jgi:hypothetical protein